MAKNKNLKLDLTLDEVKLLHEVCTRDDYMANVEQEVVPLVLNTPLTDSIVAKLEALLPQEVPEKPPEDPLLHFTAEGWEQDVLKSKLPVLVDFTASWCGPCQTLAPYVAQIAEGRVGTVKVGKLDIDAEESITDKYGVQSVPTLLVFVDGEVAGQSVGLSDRGVKKGIEEFLDNAIKGKRPGLPTKKRK